MLWNDFGCLWEYFLVLCCFLLLCLCFYIIVINLNGLYGNVFKPIILAILVGCLIFILIFIFYACLWMWGMNDFCNQAEQNGYFMMNGLEFVVEVLRQLCWKLFQFAPDGDERGDGYLSAGSLPLVGHAAVMYNLPSSRTLHIDCT